MLIPFISFTLLHVNLDLRQKTRNQLMRIGLTRYIHVNMLIINEYIHAYRLTDCVTDRRAVCTLSEGSQVLLPVAYARYLCHSCRISLEMRHGSGLLAPDIHRNGTRSIVLVIAVVDVLEWRSVSRTTQAFPSPLVITVGVPKGGDCKTWTALNLASRFGCWGYDVTVVDCNGTHDLLTDWRLIQRAGYWPRFEVVKHTVLNKDGDQAPMMDFSFLAAKQVVIFDTCQFLNLQMTKWAWRNCHLLIMPVTPNMQQMPNYEVGIQYTLNMPKPRAPLAVLPCKVNVLKNMVADQMLDEMLKMYTNYANEGIIVPEFGTSYQIPESKVVQSMNSRWIYAENVFKGQVRTLSVEFLLRVDISLAWIRSIVERFYGPLPAPRLRPVTLDPHSRPRTMIELKEEMEGRTVLEPA